MPRRIHALLSGLVAVALAVATVQALSLTASPTTSRASAAAASGTGGQFVPLQARILDTRSTYQIGPYSTPMPAGAWRKVQVEGVAGIPSSGVAAVAINFTVVNQQAAGLLHADKDETTPNSTITYMNYLTGAADSNTATLAVATDGKIQAYSSAVTDLLIDVQGYYTADDTVAPGGYVPITPARVVDTRTGADLPKAKLDGGSTTTIQMGGLAGIPAGASGVMVNFTITNNTATSGHVFTPWPADEAKPSVTMDFQNGPAQATGAQVGLSTTGTPTGAFKFALSGSGYSTDLIVDVVGYFMPGTSTGAYTPAAARVWDTRQHVSIASGATQKVQVAGVSGVPQAGSGIGSVTTNLAVIAAGTHTGFFQMWADGTPKPATSVMNYLPASTTSNMATSALGSNGAVDLYNSGPDAVNFVLDVEGWYTTTGAAISNGQSQTAQSVTLQAAPTGGGPWVTYQYRVGITAGFVNVPVANASDGSGNHPSAWPVQKISGAFTAYAWNIRDTLAAIPANAGLAPDSLVQVQACYGVSSTDPSPACGMPSSVNFSQADGSSASQDIAPGSVDELTGDFSVNQTDANATASLGSLAVSRSLTTLHPAPATTGAQGVFGPGWTADFSDDSSATNLTPVDRSAQGYVLLTDADGYEAVYSQDPLNSQRYLASIEDADDQSVLTHPNATTFVLTDPDGSATTWTKTSTGWQLSTMAQPGSNATTSYTYSSAGLVTRVLAPVPSGISCATPDTTPGCRSLTLTYSSVPVGGSTATRLTEVDLSIPQSAGTPNSIPVAMYDYDTAGRLAHAWDPRISPALKTAYSYGATGRLATLTPPGLAAWSFGYDSAGRLITVARPDPSGPIATTTLVYDIQPANSGANAGPVDLTAQAAARWGETDDLPVTGTALFTADYQPAGTTVSAVNSGDWAHASIDYLDVNGNVVNTARYGNSSWLIDTSQYDQAGNEIWSLNAGNRAQALTPTADTDPYVAALSSGATVDSVDAAALLRTDTLYNPLQPGQVTDTYGPAHPVRLSSGTTIDARTHVATGYDEGAPTTATDPTSGQPVNPATGQPYGLPTSVTTTAYDLGAQTDTTWPDSEVTRTGYGAVATGDTPGWTLGKASTRTAQLGGTPATNDLVTATRYDANGRVIEVRRPNDANGSTPRTTDTLYYSATGSGGCVDARKVGLPCSAGPASQPASGNPLPVITYNYDQYGDQTAEIATYGSGASQVVRTTSAGYDAAQRRISSTSTVTPAAAGGTPLPPVSFGYDAATGLASTTSTGTGASTVSLSTGYDTLGQAISYTDATGNLTRATYDLAGRPISLNDGKGTTTNTYDRGGDYRGLVSNENIGTPGSPADLSAVYNAAGALSSETYPNGLVATRNYDNAGNLTALSYTKSGATWMAFASSVNAVGQLSQQTGPQSSQTFSYDGADRLTRVQDTYANACTTRSYALDAHSNRTVLDSYPAATGGACTTGTAPTETRYTYDGADRLTSDTAGTYSYDALGRTLTMPAGDAQGIAANTANTGTASLGYYANDMVATEQQGSANQSFTLDPDQNRISTTTIGSTTTANHYSGESDAPSWTSTAPGTWTRNILGIDGGLVATASDAGAVTLQLANPHGDIVATVADSNTATGLASYSESTEFGQPRNAAGAYPTYGWLGSSQRSVNDLAGLTLMGLRLYNASTGRFESPDPVPDGNSNAYIYPANPITNTDISGQIKFSCGYLTCTLFLGYPTTRSILHNGGLVTAILRYLGNSRVIKIARGIVDFYYTLIQWAWYHHRLVKFKWPSFLAPAPMFVTPIVYRPHHHYAWRL